MSISYYYILLVKGTYVLCVHIIDVTSPTTLTEEQDVPHILTMNEGIYYDVVGNQITYTHL